MAFTVEFTEEMLAKCIKKNKNLLSIVKELTWIGSH